MEFNITAMDRALNRAVCEAIDDMEKNGEPQEEIDKMKAYRQRCLELLARQIQRERRAKG